MEDEYTLLYSKTIKILENIKLTRGPQAVSGTLRKHPILADFIKRHQMSVLSNIEAKLSS